MIFFTARIRKTLALPDEFTAGAGDCIRGKFLFQWLPTNWTISAPHIHTCLFTNDKGLSAKQV
jgi:hypothetical protein